MSEHYLVCIASGVAGYIIFRLYRKVLKLEKYFLVLDSEICTISKYLVKEVKADEKADEGDGE